ncbi:hypothetical protein H7K09_15300 [Mycolicibacterium duvalii]|nr:hypothetical protein [Mycolicibacterium duvalii]
MSMVVERGLARCPRCVSVADYAFIEYARGMRYEVRCRKCGECYEEESRPSAALAPVPAPEPPIEWPPDHDPVPPRDWRAELRDRVSEVARHGRTGIDLLGRSATAFGTQALTWVRDHQRRGSTESGSTESEAGPTTDAKVSVDQTGG